MKSRIKLSTAGFLGFITIVAMIFPSCTQESGGIKSISAPTIISTTPYDGMVNVDNGTTISITFSESMRLSSFSVNSTSTSCSGTIQLSSDGFTTCVMMESTIASSSGNSKITVTPAASLDNGLYQIKVTTAASDVADDNLSSEYVSINGFATPVVGELDPTFGTNGSLIVGGTAGGSNLDDSGNAIAIDSDGKLVVAGNSNSPTSQDMVIFRYMPDGTLDTSFNSPNGYLIAADFVGLNSTDNVTSIVIDSNGNIVVAGTSGDATDDDAVIVRLTSDGTADLSFDGDGFVILDSSGGLNDKITSIAIDSLGKIVAVGAQDVSGDLDMSIWKLNSDGSLDTSFNGSGVLTVSNTAGGPPGPDEALDVLIDSNDQIIVSGYSFESGGGEKRNMVVWKFNPDGSLDTTFNSSGPIPGAFVHNGAAGGSDNDKGVALTLQSDSSLLIGGNSVNASLAQDTVIWKFDSNGTLDSANFNAPNGYAVIENPTGASTRQDTILSIAIDSTGKSISTGRRDNGSDGDMVVYRASPDGNGDTTFNNSGIFTIDVSPGANSADQGKDLVVDAFNRIYIVGSSQDASADLDMVIWKIR